MEVELVASDVHILIRRLPAWIGRSPQADVRVDDPEVGQYHCGLYEQGSLLLIRDFGSAHGTFVNGRRVQQRVLTSGDCVAAGRRRFLVLFDPVSASADESAPHAVLPEPGRGELPGDTAAPARRWSPANAAGTSLSEALAGPRGGAS